MTDAAKKLSKEARSLSPAERIELVDDILASLDEIDPAIDRLWVKAIALEEVLAKYRAK